MVADLGSFLINDAAIYAAGDAGGAVPDSAALPGGFAGGPGAVLPAVFYPRHTAESLREFLGVLASAGGRGGPALTAMREPPLYTLAAALYQFGRDSRAGLDAALADAGFVAGDADATVVETWQSGFMPKLQDELRWRDCRMMGRDPAGPVRRGRLLQLVGSFTELAVWSASPLHRHKLIGDCPFCGATASLAVLLANVQWHCFGCQRRGGLVEFAAELIGQAISESAASAGQNRANAGPYGDGDAGVGPTP